MRFSIFIAGVMLPFAACHADTVCDKNVSGTIDSWSTGHYLFNCLVDKGANPGPVIIQAQPASYRLDLLWGGHDKSNGTPNGDIQLLVGVDAPKHTIMKYRPDPGDDDKTWRWDGVTSVVVPAGERRKISVLHSTTNSNAQNTYLRIRFVSSN